METGKNIFSEVEAIQDKYEGRIRELDVRYAEHGCLQDLLDWRKTYINFSLLQYESLLEYHVLHQYVEDRCVEGKNNYVMVDEVDVDYVGVVIRIANVFNVFL